MSDIEGLTDIQNLQITVLDGIDYPEITSFGGAKSVELNIREFSNIVGKVSAKIDGNHTLKYSIVEGLDSGEFEIESNTGIVRLKNTLYLPNQLIRTKTMSTKL